MRSASDKSRENQNTHFMFNTFSRKEKNKRIREKNRSTEHSKGNKTVPEKVATTCTEDGHK
jgi:hypothetical protein